MMHECPKCDGNYVNHYEGEDIIMLCCKNCGFCWADYKEDKFQKPKIIPIDDTPPSSEEPEP